jgi:hypothetical protein
LASKAGLENRVLVLWLARQKLLGECGVGEPVKGKVTIVYRILSFELSID